MESCAIGQEGQKGGILISSLVESTRHAFTQLKSDRETFIILHNEFTKHARSIISIILTRTHLTLYWPVIDFIIDVKSEIIKKKNAAL